VCIGAALTLMEARVVLGQLLDRWPGLSLLDAAPRWGDKPAYRGLTALQLQHNAIATSRAGRPLSEFPPESANT
jgi:cytochrome P450